MNGHVLVWDARTGQRVQTLDQRADMHAFQFRGHRLVGELRRGPGEELWGRGRGGEEQDREEEGGGGSVSLELGFSWAP